MLVNCCDLGSMFCMYQVVFCISAWFPVGTIFLLENLRFHVEEEGKGVDAQGKKVSEFHCVVLTNLCSCALISFLSDYNGYYIVWLFGY